MREPGIVRRRILKVAEAGPFRELDVQADPRSYRWNMRPGPLRETIYAMVQDGTIEWVDPADRRGNDHIWRRVGDERHEVPDRTR